MHICRGQSENTDKYTDENLPTRFDYHATHEAGHTNSRKCGTAKGTHTDNITKIRKIKSFLEVKNSLGKDSWKITKQQS